MDTKHETMSLNRLRRTNTCTGCQTTCACEFGGIIMRLKVTRYFYCRLNIGMIRSTLTILLIFIISSCASIPPVSDRDSYLSKNIPPDPEKTIIYYYPSIAFDVFTYKVSLDGFFGNVDNSSYMVWETKPGKHTIQIQNVINNNIVQARKTFSTTGGQTLFFTYGDPEPQTILKILNPLSTPNISLHQVSTEKGTRMINRRALAKWHKTLPLPTARSQVNEDINNNVAINKWAIVVGISKYQYAGQNGLNDLVFADDDAKSFTLSLLKSGWVKSHMKILTNKEANKRNIEIALESWLTKAGVNDQIVLFWSGHGFTDPEDPEKAYFATYDTDISIPATGFRMDQVRRILEERKTKNVIVFADTCHAGKLITRGVKGISIIPQIDKMIREQRVPKGWIFMVGADTDRKAIEHTSWTNGAFTYLLIKGLSGEADGFQSAGIKDGVVNMGELRSYMNTIMPDETQKILGVAKRPVIATNSGDPEIWNLTLQVAP